MWYRAHKEGVKIGRNCYVLCLPFSFIRRNFMRADHRPYWLRNFSDHSQSWWQRRFLEPQFESVGVGLEAALPWRVNVFGKNVSLGKHVHLYPSKISPILFCTWPNEEEHGTITIGDHVLITPGARIMSARSITLGDGTMLASNVVLSDSDWHGIYDRTSAPGDGAPIVTGRNAWIGERAILCKGVTIGENSIVGAGSVVTKDVPDNVIAAGNPAKVVKELDPTREMVTRASYFAEPEKLDEQTQAIYKWMMKDNSFWGLLRSLMAPTRKD
jgi:acetyltransferase-like isoleucine patch superfamily enzyme